jgi:superfamily II DNA or RNA helicase
VEQHPVAVNTSRIADVEAPTGAPEPGQLVRARGRSWVVAEVDRSDLDRPQHLVTLTSVEDDAYDETVQLLWEVEPGTRVMERATLPTPRLDGFDDPDRLAAFLDAVRWGAVTSADSTALQSPFRSGIAIEDYQLDPVVRAVRMPRVNLLIADDVGLGKTIEAGLVAQELLLRHRARTVLVVCPASLCVKWRDEMAEKFGLEFRIVDSDLLRHLRRTRGLRANPWTHFPRLIVSMDWLKRDRPMRLLREVLPPVATYPRKFDLLIVDEIHNAAPSGRGKYATDSQRTTAIRTIAPHFEHRLFLSATPHNGYRESWTALLEMLDSQRFARGVDADPRQLEQIMVRRLKSELPPLEDGTPRFPRRVIDAIEVHYSDAERTAHRMLADYADSRRKTGGDDATRTASDFSLKLLKKRLFSSPAAFANTLDVHTETMESGARAKQVAPTLRVLSAAVARSEDDVDDVEAPSAVRDALAVAGRFASPLTGEERRLLANLKAWARGAEGRADAKAEALIAWLEGVVRPADPATRERRWSNERVIIFTEYRDTQRWLTDLLTAHGLGGDRLALLFGGMDEDKREHTKAIFQADPSLDPVRILLATDSASEGIDLQLHCHRLVHYEIPWNPNRLEQRNGRVDRHGQKAPAVLVHHFVGAGYENAQPGSIEEDLEFLLLVARKVDTIREDLGSAGPVIADQVEERMLGKRRSLDTAAVDRAAPQGRISKLDRELSKRIGDLRRALDASITELHLQPENVERVVRTALALARQPPLAETTVDRSDDVAAAFILPRLTGSWARATEGLSHPVTGKVRPVTFDHKVASGHDDVVLAHLGHRLVQQALWLLRAEIWLPEADARLGRITARVIADGIVEAPTMIAHGRLVITGGDGRRLHEEVIAGGGFYRQGRFARITTLGQLQAVIDAPTLLPASESDRRAFVREWPKIADGVLAALERRKDDRAESLDSVLSKRAEEDVASITAVLNELRRAIRAELAEATAKIQLQLSLFAADERNQVERDIEALHRRLDEIPGEIVAESANVRRRYADPIARLFPAAVELCVPESQSKR